MKSNVLKKHASLWAMLQAVVLSLSVAGAVYAASDVDLSQSPEVSGTAEGQIKMPKIGRAHV